MLNMDAIITIPDVGTLNVTQLIETAGMTETINSLPQITKEEFYNLL